MWADAQSYFDKAEAAFKVGDNTESVKWYRKAANQGHTKGQKTLGVMYQYGLGVPKDRETVRRWHKLPAEQGHSGAQDIMNSSVPWWKFCAFYGW